MVTEQHVREFMSAAINGVSKAQVIRTFRDDYNLNDDDIGVLLKACNFKRAPRNIDYKEFAEIDITKNAERIYYPFTRIYKIKNFLNEYECDRLIENIDQSVRPSTVSNPTDECVISDYRTSQTADLCYLHDDFYLHIDKKITGVMGLMPFLGETMQAQRYEPGQYYKEHWDFFMPGTQENKIYCEWMGQRTWTAMIYLNDVEKGGETYFKHLKLRVKPERGLLLAWNNLYKNGLPNLKTMHEAMPPVSGNKYVITKWFRSYSLI
jgi:prolyl 4-hydroxylase